ncbi:MAG: VWA domain-containing protein [Pseudomonadota bacterium]
MAQPPIASVKKVKREFSEKDYKQRSQNLVKSILSFANLLRNNRVPVHMTKQLDSMAALKYVNIESRFEFYMALKSTMIVSHKYFPIFDQLFDSFWKTEDNFPDMGCNDPENDIHGESFENKNTAKNADDENGEEEVAGKITKETTEEDNNLPSEEEALPSYSLSTPFKEKDFEDVKPEELYLYDELFKSLRINIKEKKGRRYKSSNKGKIIDLQKSIRQSRQKGGEIINIFKKEKKPKRSKLVLLADVSGSMDVYSTFLIKFIYELQKHLRNTETFVFGAQLKRITDLINYRSIKVALSMLSNNVLFWSGGTNLGGSFEEFNDRYGGKLRKKSRILVILSDGWDKGDIDLLKKQMSILKKGFKKIIWLNPNLKYDNYEPLCMGMSAAMPYVDYFLPCHNLKTLEAFIELIKKI